MAGKDTPNPIPEQPKPKFELHKNDLFIPGGETHTEIAPEEVDWAHEVPVKFVFAELGPVDAYEVIADPEVSGCIAEARRFMTETPGRHLRVVVTDHGPYVEDIDTGEYVEDEFRERPYRHGVGRVELPDEIDLTEARLAPSVFKTVALVYGPTVIALVAKYLITRKLKRSFWTWDKLEG